MRKALNTPAVLFEWFTPAEGVTLEALLAALRAPERLSGASARRFFVADSPRVEAALAFVAECGGACRLADVGGRFGLQRAVLEQHFLVAPDFASSDGQLFVRLQGPRRPPHRIARAAPQIR